jgi:hypothetical protein
MQSITILLSDERFAQLREIARRYEVSTEDLARVGVEELLARPEDKFQEALHRVLGKNAELYRRLA